MNKKNINTILFIILSAVLLFTSCSNLPQKVNVAPTQAPDGEGYGGLIQNPNQNPDEHNNQIQVIENWSEPGPGATATPIVLGIEKRGEEAPVIIRTQIPEFNPLPGVPYSDNNSQVYQAPVNNVMKDSMEIVGYNPRSGTTVTPKQSLHLDVTLKNTGTTTWQTSYKVIDISETPMAIIQELNLPYAVAPGGTVVLSIYMAAPSALGSYQESFRIQDAYGAVFGNFDYVYNVGDVSYITEIPTLTATITPTYYSPLGITATPDSLAWMCIDPERSKLQDCYSFCVEYSYREEFRYCFYDGQRYTTPVPENYGG